MAEPTGRESDLNQTEATNTGDVPDLPWTRRKAEAILCAAWAAPFLLTLAAAIGVLWSIHYEKLIAAHLAPVLRARTPALWTMGSEALAERCKREAEQAGHAFAAMHLLIPLAAAAAIVVIGLLKD